MVSFDIKSPFTNIPLDETITIIVNKLFHNVIRFHGFFREQFTKLLQFSLKNCRFLFNDQLFEQTDGVAMDSPLRPLFANIFLSYHEEFWLDNCPKKFKPSFYRQ